MNVQTFIHRHYSLRAGESPIGHAAAVLVGLALIAIGAALVATLVWHQIGVALGILGILVLGAGVFGHIQTPLKIKDLLDTVVGLAGAAITLTFALAVAAFVIGFTATVAVLVVQWLVS
jgi:hypothetical protein